MYSYNIDCVQVVPQDVSYIVDLLRTTEEATSMMQRARRDLTRINPFEESNEFIAALGYQVAALIALKYHKAKANEQSTTD